ncbi:DUF1616 domain-containing protein [Haloarcula litorea]|uniref:DUF1616 domain-containing protein n=1 Tax=Haloarcula litorea TaxID=3032579 RepID=UPI0023E8C4E1|nr:DUF1616 domain-containing protein [Halomicroarcula sp. GDY20]
MAESSQPAGNSRFFPLDLVVVALLGVWTTGIGLGLIGGSPARFELGLLAILFIPGYAVVSALFPGHHIGIDAFDSVGYYFSEERNQRPAPRHLISIVERLVLSIGLSVCLVPIVGLVLISSPLGVQPQTFLSTIGIVTMTLAVVAAVRRTNVTPAERFTTGIIRPTPDGASILTAYRRASSVTVVFSIGILIAGAGIGYAATTSHPGEQFTEFYLITDTTGGGDDGADSNPITLAEPETLQIGISNYEGRETEYTVVAVLELLEEGNVRAFRQLQTFDIRLAAGEETKLTHTVGPVSAEDDARLSYLLFKGPPPRGETGGVISDRAYRQVHVWVESPQSSEGNSED